MKISKNLDYSTRDYEGFRTDMIKGLQSRIPEYTDTSQTDAGIVLIEQLAHSLDILSYYNDKTANEVYLDTAQERDNIIMLAKMMGYVLDDGKPSEFKQIFEIIPQDVDFIIPRGFVVKTTHNDIEEEVLFETSDTLVIPKGCVGNEKDENGEYLYAVNVVHGVTVKNEIVGTSNGTANQRFYLNETPVIKDSISLVITESNGVAEEWTRVDNFLNSSPTDQHFTLSIDASDRGIITFGNGKSGAIPTPYTEGIVATYRIGGGEVGNVSAMTIKQFEQKISGMVKTYNPYKATVLGVDKEDNETIKVKAKSTFKSTWGAITLEDYKDIATTFEEVIDATSETGRTSFDVIVNILPRHYEELSEEDLKQLKNKLAQVYDKRKVLGVDVFINYAEIVDLHPKIDIMLYPNILKKDIENLTENVMKSTFRSSNRLLGETLHPSEIISELMLIEGVKSVNCVIEDLPTEVKKGQVLNVGSYSLNLIGGI